MNKYSFEKAQNEAEKVREIARDIKDKKDARLIIKSADEPIGEDYKRANALIDSGYEKNLVSYGESYKLAKELLEKYQDKINSEVWDNMDADGVMTEKAAIQKFISQIPEDIMEHYEGHGITRGSEKDKLAAVINIIQNKTIAGWGGKIVRSGSGYDAYLTGPFLILSPYNQSLAKLGRKGSPVFHKIINTASDSREGIDLFYHDERGERSVWEANIGAVVVNTRFYPLVEELKKLFPDVKIIKANEVINHIMSEAKDK